MRILREAGARVRTNVFLRDAAVSNIDPSDGRRIEIVASGLPLHHGTPIAVDTTLISPLHSNGRPFPNAHLRAGASFGRAIRSKHASYPELVDSPVLRLVVVASEVGGRCNLESLDLIEQAAFARSQSDPVVLRESIARNWRARWTSLLSVCVQDTLAATLVDHGFPEISAGPAPLSVDVWLDNG